MEKAYLFNIVLWWQDEPEYILVYGKNENEAREKGSSRLKYNGGQQVKPKDLNLKTFF